VAKKQLGFTELYWTCPNCQTNNPGLVKKCNGCGAVQPENVEFKQKTQQELLTDKEKIAVAEQGPDIHCAFCGARNVASATICVNCGADLKEGKTREAGKVLGNFATNSENKTITCPACGTDNPAAALNCSSCGVSLKHQEKPRQETTVKKVNWLPIVIVAAIIMAICGLLIFAFSPKGSKNATVNSVTWSRSMNIEEIGPVEKSDWRDNIPSDAQIGSCESREHHTQDFPASNSVEECGEPYTVDRGNGVAEVVQDCEYHVYQDYCNYTVEDWKIVETMVAEGKDLQPKWPDPILKSGQRIGSQSEEYTIIFRDEDGLFEYSAKDLSEFQNMPIGSEWKITKNRLGGIVEIEPAN
jgi:ribosomal protein L40E